MWWVSTYGLVPAGAGQKGVILTAEKLWDPGAPRRQVQRQPGWTDADAAMERRTWRWIAGLAAVVVLGGGLLFVFYAAYIAS